MVTMRKSQHIRPNKLCSYGAFVDFTIKIYEFDEKYLKVLI